MKALRQQIDQQAEFGNRLSQGLADTKEKLRLQQIQCEHARVGKNRAGERVIVLEGSLRAIRENLARIDDPPFPTAVMVIDEDGDDDEEELDAPKPPTKRKRQRAC